MTDQGTGLRERKRERTHDAIQAVATRLFTDRGFDGVSVAEIAEAAGVAPRTFYRYFDSKESLVLGHVDDTAVMFAEALAARPTGEPLVASIRTIVVGIARAFEDDDDTNRLRARLIATHPGIAQRHLERQALVETQLTPLLAEHMGITDPDDQRPALLAACSMAAGRVAMTMWLQRGATGRIGDVVDEAFDLINRGFAETLPTHPPRSTT